jgi:uncharacterized membrane protein
VLLAEPVGEAEAEVVAEVTMDTTSLILVFTLPIIPITTFMLKEVAAAADKALAVMAALVALVIVLTLMVTILITAEHLLADPVHHMAEQADQELVNQVVPVELVDTVVVITMLVALVDMDMVLQVLVQVDQELALEQLEHMEQMV